ncbi:Arginine transport ATP-binding protein ArtM [Arcanobacterium haemolyticum]|uniref:amino acid ABC transporter ATP-binding protein n=1 Tax=Arcanobacterium haemolyticum TaxID=28264 RepID=UPI000D8F9BF4|nr:amino acid ABC transporter ATP-binding protein [Arcanobacterium haemolyticum]SPT75987.1 Arginine transport ATP-binding protein ArtM [Arcanobacterium haemolyticum]
MLRVDSLTKRFTAKDGSEVTALQNMSIDFDPAETTVILGPSGSGKSTLLRTLNLLETPDSGMLSVSDCTVDFSKKLTKDDKRTVRSHSAMVFQDFQLFAHLTVLENVTLGPIKARVMAKKDACALGRELIATVGLSGREDAYPYQLSGGQKQRVAIARALAMEPEFLLCDEPTSALDPELASEVRTVLQRVAEGNTAIVLVTHDMGFARKIADRIIFMQDGVIGFDGCATEFFSTDQERIVKFRQVFDA